jgi:5-methylcytosine-specific restriction enzyme A
MEIGGGYAVPHTSRSGGIWGERVAYVTVTQVIPALEKQMADHGQWYSHRRWRQRRARQLQAFPLCQWCERRGLVVVAEVAHHVEPHHGNRVKFWHGELISLCKACHDADAQTIERGGKLKPTIGVDGFPVRDGP